MSAMTGYTPKVVNEGLVRGGAKRANAADYYDLSADPGARTDLSGNPLAKTTWTGYDPNSALAKYGTTQLDARGNPVAQYIDWSKLDAFGAKDAARDVWTNRTSQTITSNNDGGSSYENLTYAPKKVSELQGLWTSDPYFNQNFASRILQNQGQLNLNELPKEVRARMGLDPNDNSETSVIFTDPTKPFWGAQGYKKDGGFANWWKDDGQGFARMAAAAAAAYGAGAAMAAGGGEAGAAGAVGSSGTGAGTGAATTSSGILGSGVTTGSALGDTMIAGSLKGAGMGALSGGGSAAMQGGDILKGALKGAGTGALTGGIGAGVSAGLSSIPSTSSFLGSGMGSQIADSAIKQGISGAVTGGIRSGLSGGNILSGMGQGALGGAVGGAVSTGTNGLVNFGNKGVNDVARGTIAGTITGGLNSLIKNKNVQTGLLTGAIGGLSSGVGKAVGDYTDSSTLGNMAKSGVGYLTQGQLGGRRPTSGASTAAPSAQQQKLAQYGQMIDNYFATKGINASTAQKRQMLQALMSQGG